MKRSRTLRAASIRIFAAAAIALAGAARLSAQDANPGGLRWQAESQSFQAEIGQEQVVATYAFVNEGDKPVTIQKASASCGCTVPSLDKTVYAPGESGELTAIFTIGARQGHQSKSIQVLTDEGGVPASYALLLEVDIPVPVTLKPRVRFWRVGEKAAPQEVAVSLDPAAAMTIAGLERQSDSDEPSAFDYEVQTVEEGREYVVRITPKSSGEKARDVFYLTSPDDESGLLRKYPIYAYVR